jgi:hypothetical protein
VKIDGNIYCVCEHHVVEQDFCRENGVRVVERFKIFLKELKSVTG